MGLKDIKLKSEVVEIPGGETFTVRGLSFTSIASLYAEYASEVSAFFDVFASGKQGDPIDVEAAGALAASVIVKAPAMAAKAIAMGAGEDDAEGFAMALQLPLPVQIDALKKIGLCTFGTEGAAKKFLMIVGSMVKGQTVQTNP